MLFCIEMLVAKRFCFVFQFILIFAWVDYTPVSYGDYEYPGWVDGLGWVLALSSVLWIPGTMLYKIRKEDEGDYILQVSCLAQIVQS